MGLYGISRLDLLWPQPLHKSWRKTLTLELWAKLLAYESAWYLRLNEQQKVQQRERLL